MLGALQGSILGSFFSIDLRDLFFIIDIFDIANLHHMLQDKYISSGVKLLKEAACAIYQWFKKNAMKANAGKCHVLLSKSYDLTVKVNEVQIKNSQSEKLLGINIDWSKIWRTYK